MRVGAEAAARGALPAVNIGDDFGSELVMPFVVVRSAGGPFDDEAFCAGVEVGALGEYLRLGGPFSFTRPYKRSLIPQLDLVAMRHRYVLTASDPVDGEDGWVSVTVTRSADWE